MTDTTTAPGAPAGADSPALPAAQALLRAASMLWAAKELLQELGHPEYANVEALREQLFSQAQAIEPTIG